MPRAKKTTAAKPETVEAEATITAYKGFDADLSCRGFRFELGGTYRHDGKVAACESGFHACAHPLDVFRHYPPATSRYAVVELGGETARHHEDSKIAAAEITIRAEIRLPDMIAAAVKYVFDRATWISGHFAEGEREGVKQTKHGGAATASGRWGAATASGWRGAATASGSWGAATASGYQGAATASGTGGAATASGEQGAATASGTGGAATASGDWGAATASGWRGAATASGWRGAATASGYQGAATASGRWGAATASGTRGAATASGRWGAATASGYQGAATASGDWGAATATGYEGKARGANGCALFLVERAANGDILHVWGGIAGRDGVEPDTFYRLAGGKPVAVE
jgi:hypothetical protein